MHAELLHVVTPVFNPVQYNSRYRLYQEFEKHMLASGVCLHVIEVQTGDRDYAVTPSPLAWPVGRYSCIQLRTRQELWLKENMINLAVSRLPEDWKYVAWIDGDVSFRNPNWAKDAVNHLQTYDVVQLFSHAEDHGPEVHQTLNMEPGFVYQYHKMIRDYAAGEPWKVPHGKAPYGGWFGHCGYAWGCRRTAWNHLGGLIDYAILGSADHHMACGLVGAINMSVPKDMSEAYRQALNQWQSHADHHIVKNIGFLHGTLDHYWHGPKAKRQYVERWKVLKDNKYDPRIDIKKDWQGLYQLTGNKPHLRDQIRLYMRQRNEDSNDAS